MSWLPDLITLEGHGGDWNAYLRAIHDAFRQDFVHRQPPAIRGTRMGLKKHPMVNGMEATFWHLISEGVGEDDRTPDLRRCERIAWPRPIIEAVDGGNVCCWPTLRGTEIRLQLAVEDFSYLVVVAMRNEYALLWTAFCVEHAHRRERLRKDYERWVQNGRSRPQ